MYYPMPYYTVGALPDAEGLKTYLISNWTRLAILSAASFAILNSLFAYVLAKIKGDTITGKQYFKIAGFGALKGAIFYFILVIIITQFIRGQSQI